VDWQYEFRIQIFDFENTAIKMNLLTSSSKDYGDAIAAKITKTVSGDKLETDEETKLLTKLTKKNDGIFDL
jgi:hypothetical protein